MKNNCTAKCDILSKTIKRRYKEFISLQKGLEDNNMFKLYLKNIKGPSKFNLSIGNMEHDTVEKRRKKLNEYLNVNFFLKNKKKFL